ncbi:MAG TPA: aminotransferase [Clostridiales bacterium]|nr:aminotransferase [Clostridiales bacterium]
MLVNLSLEEKRKVFDVEAKKHKNFCEMNLSLNMARGKPSPEQLDISNGLLDELNSTIKFTGTDYRNYGILDGIPELKNLFCDLLNVETDEIIVNENASLILMYDSLQRAMQFGVLGGKPWNEQGKIKWLCPVPGYDRHFAITELFGIEMINIPIDENGPDMDMIEELVKDPQVKGIWCVPKYSNPTGVVYSDEVVDRFAKLKPSASDFRIFWDNAYMVHWLYEDDKLLDLFAQAKKYGNENMIYMFGSTSKITFAGAGVAFIVASKENIKSLKSLMGIQSIGPNKLVQFAHYKFLKNKENIQNIMKKHAEILRPKFEKVLEILEAELGNTGIATWLKPRGGYFVACNLYEGTAKRTVELAKLAGVTFTASGATYPYKKDPKDSSLRIAPSYPSYEDLGLAMQIFCNSAKLAYLEKELGLTV